MMGFQSLLVSFSDIMNQKGRLAWELYLKMGTSSDSFSLLQLIANDCYKVTLFCISGGPCVPCSGLQGRHTWLHIINIPHNTRESIQNHTCTLLHLNMQVVGEISDECTHILLNYICHIYYFNHSSKQTKLEEVRGGFLPQGRRAFYDFCF